MIKVKELLLKILQSISSLNSSIDKLTPSSDFSTGDTVSVASETPTTVSSITLTSGTYVLLGTARFAGNATGWRQLIFSFTDNGTSPNDRYARNRIPAGNTSYAFMQCMWITRLSSTTTVYLVASHNAGTSLNASYSGIKYVALDGGGLAS